MSSLRMSLPEYLGWVHSTLCRHTLELVLIDLWSDGKQIMFRWKVSHYHYFGVDLHNVFQ